MVLLASQSSPHEKAFYSNIIKTDRHGQYYVTRQEQDISYSQRYGKNVIHLHNTGGCSSKGIRKMCFGERVDSGVSLLTAHSVGEQWEEPTGNHLLGTSQKQTGGGSSR